MAGDRVVGDAAHRGGVEMRGRVLERAHPQVAGGDSGEHGAGQHGVAYDRIAGGHHREGAGGGNPQGVHRLAHQVLAQHRADRGLAVAATSERGAAAALEVQIAP